MFMTATIDTATSPVCTSSVEAVGSGARNSFTTTTTSAKSWAAVPMLRNQPISASSFTCSHPHQEQLHYYHCQRKQLGSGAHLRNQPVSANDFT